MQAEPDASELASSVPGLAELCASLNWSIASTVAVKIKRAAASHPQARALIVAGGVAANSWLRRELAAAAGECGLEFIVPSPGLCTDNASMIAFAGALYLQAGYAHGMDLEAVPRGRPIPHDWASIP